jgi:hypothetical protein
MSRSRKKVPVVKDKGPELKFYNRKFRRKEKQALQEGKDPPVRTSEVVNDWDVCDWKADCRAGLDGIDEEKLEGLKEQAKRK